MKVKPMEYFFDLLGKVAKGPVISEHGFNSSRKPDGINLEKFLGVHVRVRNNDQPIDPKKPSLTVDEAVTLLNNLQDLFVSFGFEIIPGSDRPTPSDIVGKNTVSFSKDTPVANFAGGKMSVRFSMHEEHFQDFLNFVGELNQEVGKGTPFKNALAKNKREKLPGDRVATKNPPTVIQGPFIRIRKIQPAPDRGSFIRAVMQTGIDVEHAEAMYDVLERQRQEFEKGPNGNPLPLSGPNGLMVALQKASGLTPTRFFVEKGRATNSTQTRITRGEDSHIKPQTAVRLIKNLGLKSFGEILLRTAGVETKTADEITTAESAHETPDWCRLIKLLRESRCHNGQTTLSWLKALDEKDDVVPYGHINMAEDLGGYNGSFLSDIENGKLPDEISDGGNIRRNSFEKPIEIFSITEPHLGLYKMIVAKTVARGKEKKDLSGIIADTEREAGRMSIGLLLSKLKDNLCITEKGIMTWDKAVENKVIPYRLRPTYIVEPSGLTESFIEHCFFRPTSSDSTHIPAEEKLEKIADFFSRHGIVRTKDELLPVLKRFREDTLRYRDSLAMPGAAAAGATGEPALAPDLNREPETSPPSRP